jgi:hypothetical protein
MLHRIGKVHPGRGLALTAAWLLMTSAPAFAQTATPLSGPTVSTREGNIYDHRAHQPTAADDAAAGLAPLGVGGEDVQKEVQDLLQQTDQLDELSERHGRELPASSSGER